MQNTNKLTRETKSKTKDRQKNVQQKKGLTTFLKVEESTKG